MKRLIALLVLAIPLAAQDRIFPHATTSQRHGKSHETQVMPASGTVTIKFTENYVAKPGCWAKENGEKQHPFSFENDAKQITITATAGSTIEWECHGFVEKTAYELCMDKAVTTTQMQACWPLKEEKK